MTKQKMVTIRTVLVDDEKLARDIIVEYLARHHDVEVIAQCANGFEAVKAITELKPSLLFLDIQMPKLNGFEVLDLIESPPSVIFVTAYDQFALKAFEIHAVDYLLKPFSQERFDEALGHARKRLESPSPSEIVSLAREARPPGQSLDRILVRTGPNVHIIPVDRVDYVEAQDDYISIRADGKSHLKQQRLSDLEGLLDGNRFVRIHRSYILNIDRLSKIELYAKDSRVAILKDGTRLNVSRSGYTRLQELL